MKRNVEQANNNFRMKIQCVLKNDKEEILRTLILFYIINYVFMIENMKLNIHDNFTNLF